MTDTGSEDAMIQGLLGSRVCYENSPKVGSSVASVFSIDMRVCGGCLIWVTGRYTSIDEENNETHGDAK
jgi:hypothetical protein